MTFNQIELDVFRRLNYADSPASAVKTRIDGFINQRHRRILSMPGLSRLRDDTLPLTTIANTATYAMGPAVSRIKAIFDAATNQTRLTERTLSWVRTVDPGSNPGTPEAWIPLSLRQVQTQPSAATGLWAVSTSASDTQNVFIETVRTGGYPHQSSATALTGTTRVQIGTLTDHIEIDKFYVSAAAAGAISLYDAAAQGNELARIPIGGTYGRYLTIRLWPTPSSAWTFSVDYTRELYDMVNATDEPLLPPDFHYLLAVGARIDEYEKLDDDRAVKAQGEWDRGIARLQNYVLNSPDYIIVPGGASQVKESNLGSWYPAGSGW